MARRRHERVLLPWEQHTRRGFLKKGLLGAALLAAGGAGWLVTRRTKAGPDLGPLRVLTAEEATVLLAVADRLLPERSDFPRPQEVGVPRKVDGIVAMAHPATQKDVKRLLRLFDNALAGLVFEGQLRTFTASPPADQDARLASWARSRVTLRRSGYRALKRLVYAAYYSSPETYAAVGYRVPRAPKPAARPQAPAEPPAPELPAPEARPIRKRPPRPLAPKPLEAVPEPRGGIALPEPEP